MASLRDIRRRIRAVNNIQQITRAMYMVAAVKLKKTETQARAGRPYAESLRAMMQRVAQAGVDFEHPLLASRPVRRVLLVHLTADRGLAGPFNSNMNRLLQRVLNELRDEGLEALVLPVGRKGREYCARVKAPLLAKGLELGENITFAEARRLARLATEAFIDGRVDEVRILYSQFMSAVSQRPAQSVVLPIGGVSDDAPPAGQGHGEYLLEPTPQAIMEQLLPRYIEVEFYRAMVETKASEHGSRMTAMKNATDNAEELVEHLTLIANRARQEQITKELAEIVGGAEALSG